MRNGCASCNAIFQRPVRMVVAHACARGGREGRRHLRRWRGCAGTSVSFIANRKLALTKEVFAETFGLPTEGMTSFLDIPNQTMVEMREGFLLETSSDEDSCPLARLKKRGAKRKEVVESSDSEATVSVPQVRITKKHRTKITRRATHTSDQGESQPGPITDIPAGFDKESNSGGPEATVETIPEVGKRTDETSNADEQEGHMECGNQTEKDGLDGNISTTNQGHEGSTSEMETGADNQEDPMEERLISAQQAEQTTTYTGKADKDKGVLPYLDRPNPVEEHYLLVIQDMRDRAECQLQIYDQWYKFRTSYRLRDIPSMKLVEEYAKTENKLLPWAEMDKAVAEHWKNFHKDKPSVNKDIMAICMLEAELATTRKSVHLFQSRAAPFPQATPSKILGFLLFKGDLVPISRPLRRDDPSLSMSPSLKLSPNPVSDVNNTIIEATAKKVTSLESNVSSLGLKVERIRDDADFTRRSTVQLRQQLENAVDRLEIKIDMPESTLVRKFSDNQQNLSALESGLVRHFADSQQHLVDEVETLKSQVAEMVDRLKELRDAKKRKGPSNKKGEGTSSYKKRRWF
ncbi:flagellar inner arm dynein 1 heavy chain alpha [Dorcoceras hygrometricum]|uniref:Flagellar inner arm dynein 1 heavy chain alpha n=1 Tax=Dorcoceras hygrometricum TaxID=472368 RepID=A0A2Z7DI27_9LAMI|nr:flagellar inner arm dynein 1 heavy chain alpha [Dorcoceras hygrometricum]